MTPRVRVVVLAITFICLVLIVRQVRRREMRAIYLLVWTALTVVTIPLIAFPRSLDTLSEWLGIYYPPATIFLAATVILFLISIHFSRQLSALEERTRILAEALALVHLEEPCQTRVGVWAATPEVPTAAPSPHPCIGPPPA